MAGDVKVRFSAEGNDAVVNAFQQIREEAKKTGEEGSKSFETLKEGISEVGKELVGFLAIAAVVDKTKELFTEVVNGAVALDKLHQTTGLSTDALQALGAAAKETMVDQDALNKGLQFFSRTMGQAEEGSKKATTALANIGLQLKDLKGLNADQQFQLVAQHLAEIEDPAKRAADGAAIFGKQFLQLEPAIMAVADEGFGHFTDKLKELGVYLDGDAIAQMKAAKQGLNEIGEETKGLATQFLVGLMPAVQQSMDSFIKQVSGDAGGVGAMQKLGQIVGAVIETIEQSFEAAGEAIGAFVASAVNDFTTLGRSAKQVMTGDFKGAGQTWKEGKGADEAIDSGLKENLKANWAKMSNAWGIVTGSVKPEAPKTATAGNVSGGDFDADEADSAKMSKARLALEQAQLEAELKLFEAQSKLRLDQEKQDYESGKISLEQYYNDRAQIVQEQGAKELEILQARRAAVAASPIAKNDDGTGALQKQTELAKLDADIAAKQIETQQQLTQLKTEERAAQQKFYSDSLKAEEQLYKIQGDKAAVAKLQLADELRALDAELKKGGISEPDRQTALNTAADQGMAKIDLDKTKQDANATFTDLQTQIKSIQDLVKNGTLFPVQGEQQIIELEKQRLPVLEKMAQDMIVLAQKTGDATAIAQAQQFKEKIDQIGLSVDDASQNLANLKKTAQDSLQNGLSNFLYNVATGTESVGQAFQQMALQFVEAIAKMEAQYLASEAIKWLNGELTPSGNSGGGMQMLMTALSGSGNGGGGGGGGESGGGSDMSGWIGMGLQMMSLFMADGGHVNGPGTSTSDSIPAMLSDGEFVVNAASAQKPGMLALLHAINGTPGYARSGGASVQRYATGGQVSGGPATVNHYHVDASNIDPHIINQAVQQQVLNVIAKNPAHVRNAIG